MDHILFSLFELDPDLEDEEDWNKERLVLMRVLSDTASNMEHTPQFFCLTKNFVKSKHDSESTEDLSLDNWADNSGLLDNFFSSFLSSSSRAQPPLNLNHSHIHHNMPYSTLCANNIKLSCKNNLKVPADIKGRSQVK